MSWIVLIISGMFEAVWATALDKSDGFKHLTPSLVFLAGLVVSMGGLAYALKELPVGTAYAVWVGIGAVTTVIYAFATGAETFSVLKAVLLLGIVACVAGLKVVGEGH